MRKRGVRRTLTSQLLLTYLAIVFVPIVALIVILASALLRDQIEIITRATNAELDEIEARIESISESMARLETAYSMRTSFINLITSPETDWSNYDTIDQYVDGVNAIERELFLVSDVDSFTIFVDNPAIPERWPTIMHSSRLDDLGDFSKPWDFSYHVPLMDHRAQEVVEYAVKSRDLSYYGRHYGIMQAAVALESMLPELFMNDGSFAFYLDDGNPVEIIPEGVSPYDSFSHDVIANALDEAIASADERGEVVVRDGLFSRYYILYYKGLNPSIIFLRVCPTGDIIHAYWRYALGGVIVGLLIFVAIIMIAWYSTKRETKSLIAIMEAMKEVSKGNFDIQPPPSNTKIGEVIEARDAFISLTDQMKNTLHEMKRQEALLADTEIKAMQNQINVHFLINTVESIKMQAMLNDDEEVERSLDLLGELFHYCLRWKERFVMLSDEIAYTANYVEMMNYRNEFHVDFLSTIDEETGSLKVPKMILQPIAENAFRHSFDILGEDGVIVISAKDFGDRIKITVANSGVDFSEEKRKETLEYLRYGVPEKTTKSGSIGVKNIQERLFMFYGSDYNIEIGKDEEGRTAVIIPISKSEVVGYESFDS